VSESHLCDKGAQWALYQQGECCSSFDKKSASSLLERSAWPKAQWKSRATQVRRNKKGNRHSRKNLVGGTLERRKEEVIADWDSVRKNADENGKYQDGSCNISAQ